MTQSPSRSLIMNVASRLPALIEQTEQLEVMLSVTQEAQGKGRIEEDVCRRVQRWNQSASTGLGAAEKLIASEPARTLAEAAIQIMLAVSKAQVLSVSGLPDDERETVSGDLERLLQSALPIVADSAGIDLSEFGRAYYADRCTDPFYRGSDLAPNVETANGTAAAPPALDPIARLKASGIAI